MGFGEMGRADCTITHTQRPRTFTSSQVTNDPEHSPTHSPTAMHKPKHKQQKAEASLESYLGIRNINGQIMKRIEKILEPGLNVLTAQRRGV